MAENEGNLKCLPKQMGPYRNQQGMVLPVKFSNQAFQACLNYETRSRITFVCLVKGYSLNVRKIIEESILDYEQGKLSGNMPHTSQITLLCIKKGVKFNEAEEERCPKASPLTLAGVRKPPVESEEGKSKEKLERGRG